MEVGHGFPEFHHIRPLAEPKGERKMRITDLAIVCAYRYRMLHRTRSCLSSQQLHDRLETMRCII